MWFDFITKFPLIHLPYYGLFVYCLKEHPLQFFCSWYQCGAQDLPSCCSCSCSQGEAITEDSHPKDVSSATATWGLQSNKVVSPGWVHGGVLILVTVLGTVWLAVVTMRTRVLGVLSNLTVSCPLLAFCLANNCKALATSFSFHRDVPFFCLS